MDRKRANWFHLLNPLQSDECEVQMKGRNRVKQGFKGLKRLENGLCTWERMSEKRKKKHLSAFERGMTVGAPVGVCQELQSCWIFSSSTVSRVYLQWSTSSQQQTGGKNSSLMKEAKEGWHKFLCINRRSESAHCNIRMESQIVCMPSVGWLKS